MYGNEISGRCRVSIDIISWLETLWLPPVRSDWHRNRIRSRAALRDASTHFPSTTFHSHASSLLLSFPIDPPLLICSFFCSSFIRSLSSHTSLRLPSVPRSFRPRASYSYLTRNYQEEEILGKRYAVKRPDLDWKRRIGVYWRNFMISASERAILRSKWSDSEGILRREFNLKLTR